MFVLGFIKYSKSKTEVLLLFVYKKGSKELCLYIDFKNINSNTISNRYSILFISKILNHLKKAKVFTKLDLHNTYNLIRIYSENKWKTAFRICFNSFKYLILPFDLYNISATF